MTLRRPYPSDISDARWALIGPTLISWQQARLERGPTGEPARTDVREVFNALLYLNRTGISWRYIPHDLPPHGTVYYYYATYRQRDQTRRAHHGNVTAASGSGAVRDRYS
jgi:transposase